MAEKRSLWGSKIGFLMAAIGSAVGLGNIWRFSYMAFEHGGGAFLVPYFIALVTAGIPLMILEYVLGHREKASSPLAFVRVAPKLEFIGWWMPLAAFFGITVYYAAVLGWCINYLFSSFSLAWGADTQTYFFSSFLQITGSPLVLGGIRWPVFFATIGGWGLVWVICYRKINRGIEKACLLFMPLLFILTLGLVGWTLNLEGAWAGVVNNYLTPDWDKINVFANPAAWKVWSAAYGQIFFTLSLGFGIMITYSSYLPQKTDIPGNALWTCCTDCIYSFIAGFAVFGIVGFMAHTKGVDFSSVIKGGPQLAFVVYPEAINQLPFGRVAFGIMFFVVLIVAGISSAISLLEATACALMDKFNIPRRKAVTGLCIAGLFGSTIFTTRAGLMILDIVDHFITNYGLILGGIIQCILVGWIMKARVARAYVNTLGGTHLPRIWDFAIRWLTPVILSVIFLQTVITDLRQTYENYPWLSIILFGGLWMLAIFASSLLLAGRRWPPEKLRREHKPEDETLLT
ncbi:MAG: sodium-dependent transporter [Kiritimatiellales bacterium]